LPHGRLALLNDRLTERAADGRTVREEVIGNAAEFAACLGERFGLPVAEIDVPHIFARIQGKH
jgi:N-hydroxyarylamine O-acetyltransferase